VTSPADPAGPRGLSAAPSPQAAAPLVAVEGLRVRIGAVDLLHDVSFSIPRGGALALVGESGSGKTLTARVLTGLIGRVGGTVTGGTARFAEVDLRAASEGEWRRLRGRRIALVPQASLSSLDPVMRIGHQLGETIRELDPDADVRARSIELLEQVRLPRPAALLRAYSHELSGGMRQRVMIALALAGRPEFIVADEPTTALDVTVQKSIMDLLRDLRAETGMTLMLIAHDLAVVNMVADDVAVMRAGRLIEAGPAARVLSRPSHPYSRALLEARPEAAPKGTPLAVLDRETGELRRPELPAAVPATEARVEPLIEAAGVSVTYPGAAAPAVAPMDLRIGPGDSIGIVGESGSGKSTLGRVIVGALAPSAGTIRVRGRSWTEIGASDPLRRSVQMIFQDPYGSLTPWRTPRQIVAEVLRRWNGGSASAAKGRAGDLLNEVGLPLHAMDRLPRQLSGGQGQRVGIARALACDSQVLVADEPTSSLDISAQAQILNLLMTLRATRGLALVIISHDLSVIRHMTDSAIVMRHGAVVEQGASERLFTAPAAAYTRELVASTPTLIAAPQLQPAA